MIIMSLWVCVDMAGTVDVDALYEKLKVCMQCSKTATANHILTILLLCVLYHNRNAEVMQ